MPCGCGGSKRPVDRAALSRQQAQLRDARIAQASEIAKTSGPGKPGYTWDGPRR